MFGPGPLGLAGEAAEAPRLGGLSKVIREGMLGPESGGPCRSPSHGAFAWGSKGRGLYTTPSPNPFPKLSGALGLGPASDDFEEALGAG